MNSIIKGERLLQNLKIILYYLIFLILPIKTAQPLSAVKLYYQGEHYLNAIIIKKMFMDQGIPSEFIKLEQKKLPCLEESKTEILIGLCLDDAQNLEIIDFKKVLFFDQIGPFLKGDR